MIIYISLMRYRYEGNRYILIQLIDVYLLLLKCFILVLNLTFYFLLLKYFSRVFLYLYISALHHMNNCTCCQQFPPILSHFDTNSFIDFFWKCCFVVIAFMA